MTRAEPRAQWRSRAQTWEDDCKMMLQDFGAYRTEKLSEVSTSLAVGSWPRGIQARGSSFGL